MCFEMDSSSEISLDKKGRHRTFVTGGREGE